MDIYYYFTFSLKTFNGLFTLIALTSIAPFWAKLIILHNIIPSPTLLNKSSESGFNGKTPTRSLSSLNE